jgi:hypothetical protein
MKNGNYTLGHHLVAFLDVLGQRESFRGLRLPKNAEEEAQVKEVLRKTAGFVVSLREVFQTQFQVFEAGAAGMRAHTKETLRPNFIGFSDYSLFSAVGCRSRDAHVFGKQTSTSGRN